MPVTRLEVLNKIKELLKLNSKNKNIGVDTLALIFNVSVMDIMIKLAALEQEGHVKLYPITKKTNGTQIFMVEPVADSTAQSIS